MKKIISLMLALVLVFSLCACAGVPTESEDEKKAEEKAEKRITAKLEEDLSYTIGTGSASGTYYGYGNVLARYIAENTGVEVKVLPTDGSKANICGIDAGNYQLGFSFSDTLAYAWEGVRSFEKEGKIDSFRTVAGLYAEAVQLVTIDPEIKSVADLKGKSVAIGAPGSGVYFNATDVLEAAGLDENDIHAQYLSAFDGFSALQTGEIDAAFIVAGAPVPAVSDLMQYSSAQLVPIDGAAAEALLAECPFYAVYEVPAGAYEGQSESVKTVAVKTALIVSADADEEAVYKLVAAIFDSIDAIGKAHAKGAELSLENATEGIAVPFHKGAAKYFEEQGIRVETK